MAQAFEPSYLQLSASGELKRRVRRAYDHLMSCDLCGHHCGTNRRQTLRGSECLTRDFAMVHAFEPCHEEQRPLRGHAGAGSILFSSCTMHCVYCERWEFSQRRKGLEMPPQQLAGVMLRLQEFGCHNINLVTSGHMVAQILEAVALAAERGLRLPLVYQSCGYDSVEALELLDGVIDIYAPAMKFGDSATARRCAGVADYVEINRAAVREMHRQVGDLQLDENGVARRGLLVRHMLLPQGLAQSDRVLDFIADEVSLDTYIDLIGHYHPAYRADRLPPLDGEVSPAELAAVASHAHAMGLARVEVHGGAEAH